VKRWLGSDIGCGTAVEVKYEDINNILRANTHI